MIDTRIAVLCLVPASGHLMPLLKIAAQVRSVAHIDVVVPDELMRVVRYYGFQASGFGPVEPAGGGPALQAYGQGSEVSRVLGGLARWEREYFAPLRAAVRRSVPRVCAILSEAQPTALLADHPFFFWPELEEIASATRAPLLAHSGSPNAERHNTWSLKGCFFGDARSLVCDAAEKTWNELRLLARQRRGPLPLAAAAAACATPAQGLPSARPAVMHLSSGIRFLERELLADQLLYSGEGRIVLPALPPLEAALEPGLLEWLDAGDAPVAYLSLGTLINDSAILRDVLGALLAHGMRVLVHGGPSDLAGPDPDRVRQVAWLPQATAIAHPAVSLVITHGGSASVEEALWHGRPILAVPHAWDQHYNAWIARKLGASVTLRRHRGGLRLRAEDAVRRALSDEVRENARALSAIMQACWLQRKGELSALFRPAA